MASAAFRLVLWCCLGLVLSAPIPSLQAQTSDEPDYRIKKLLKRDIRYRIREDGTVRVLPYFLYQLAGEDEEAIYIKEYRLDASTVTVPDAISGEDSPAPPVPVDANPAALIASVNRLQLLPFDDGLPQQGQWRQAFDVADINADGHLDIIHGPPRKGGGRPQIFLGDSAGHWRLWRDAKYPSATYDYGAVAVADFNRDGAMDIALAAHLRGTVVLFGDGQGDFQKAPSIEAGDESNVLFTTRTLLAYDWNQDGWPDLLGFGEGPRPLRRQPLAHSLEQSSGSFGWVLYLNRREQGWQRLLQAVQPPRTFGDALAVADFNGDGRADLLTSSYSSGNKYLLHYSDATGQLAAEPLPVLPDQLYVTAIAAADFDGDGRSDIGLSYIQPLAAGGWRTSLAVLINGGAQEWQIETLYSIDKRVPWTALAAGDADTDGGVDLAALDNNGRLWLFLRDQETLAWSVEHTPELTALGAGCRGYHLRLVNLDAHPGSELIASFASDDGSADGQPGCPKSGRIQAWSVRVLTDQE